LTSSEHALYYTHMLDQRDLTQVGNLLKENSEVLRKEMKENSEVLRKEMKENNTVLVKEIVAQVGEVLKQQILPQISTLGERLDSLEVKVDSLEKKVTNLPDKSYLDDKIADLKGELVVKMKRGNEKADFTVGLLHERGVFTEDDVRRIQKEFQIFPSQSP